MRVDHLCDEMRAIGLWLANGLDREIARVESVGDDALDIRRLDGGKTIMMGLLEPATLRCCWCRGRGYRTEYTDFVLADPSSIDRLEEYLAAKGLAVRPFAE